MADADWVLIWPYSVFCDGFRACFFQAEHRDSTGFGLSLAVSAFSFHSEGEQSLKILHFYQGEERGLRQTVRSCQVKWDEFEVGLHTGKWLFQM